MFLLIERLHHPKDKKYGTPYALRHIVISPKPDWFGGAVKVRRHQAVETERNERMARNSTERGAWYQVRSGIERIHFFLYTNSKSQHNSSSFELCGIMLG